ncbi:type I restriction-modification enzyme R subunit C-terminal domain-containing protein [Actinoallomurus sp. NPDC052274]|uniref:type I restriction-modification enzyme R subunit C-terminal domain-containing protein n=1 Tax=Actinoallomurus sp. NPDC052274 TaxID=3155420 RepID=UPI003425BC17
MRTCGPRLGGLAEQPEGFGLLLRSITGLQREAARAAFDDFQAGKTLTPAQHDFIGLIFDSLAQNGVVEVGDLYEQPFTSRAPRMGRVTGWAAGSAAALEAGGASDS